MSHTSPCPLCVPQAEQVLWQDAQLRIILAGDADYPGLCRVIWHAHIQEMSDLPSAEQTHIMRVVFAVEQVLRQHLNPDKVNLASLGNMVPHLHWHIIPRFVDDRHFPQAIWGEAQRVALTQHGINVTQLSLTLQNLLGVG